MEKIKEIVLNNIHLKILSLLVAFLLWLNITSTQKTQIEFMTEVKIKNPPKNLIIQKIEPSKVSIKIEGIRSKLNRVNISNIEVYIDGKKLKKGKNLVKVYVSPRFTESFTVISVRPEKVYVYTISK
ncbi:CdaR family protein [Persephonella sp. KM09-Lau-8]|uniref:CdaR family protein n=1 Tax=Persephonella sp. KM09-Lau-8 TaxID=1158345 RepID=UPI0004981949|nr:CdaR family protein [Persephonella sp. KM09-Lau-8]